MTRPRLLGLGLGLSLALVATTAPPAAAEDVPVDASTVAFTVTGHGYGHGHGMSQYGAKGAASQGLGWQQIVGFYYPGTQLGRARGSIRVLLTAATKKSLTVEDRDGLRLHRVGTRKVYRLDRLRPKATRWKITPRGQKSIVTYQAGGGWRRLVALPGEAEFTAGNQPVTLRLPGGEAASYRGALRSVDKTVVNVLPLERYLRGVVPQEVPAEWPAAAVQAQAVAARTYAAYERAEATGSYDICDTTSCQVYGGADAEHPAADAAVRATSARVVTYQGAPAFTQFASSNGGYSSAGSQPYLVTQPDPYEAASGNPNATWTATVPRATIEQEYPQFGQLSDIAITRDAQGNRVVAMVLTGPGGSVTISGDDFRSLAGLKSDWFALTTTSQRELVRRLVPWGAQLIS